MVRLAWIVFAGMFLAACAGVPIDTPKKTAAEVAKYYQPYQIAVNKALDKSEVSIEVKRTLVKLDKVASDSIVAYLMASKTATSNLDALYKAMMSQIDDVVLELAKSGLLSLITGSRELEVDDERSNAWKIPQLRYVGFGAWHRVDTCGWDDQSHVATG